MVDTNHESQSPAPEEPSRFIQFQNIELVTWATRCELLEQLETAIERGEVLRQQISSSKDLVVPLKDVAGGHLVKVLNPDPEKGQKFVLEWAAEEFVLNGGAKHGNMGDPQKELTVCYGLDKQRSVGVLYVGDEGDGFNLREVRNPIHPENIERATGRGLFVADALHFGKVGAKGYYLPHSGTDTTTREILIHIPHPLPEK